MFGLSSLLGVRVMARRGWPIGTQPLRCLGSMHATALPLWRSWHPLSQTYNGQTCQLTSKMTVL